MSEPSEAPPLPEGTSNNSPIEESATVRRSTRRTKGKLAKNYDAADDDASKQGLEKEGGEDEANTQTVVDVAGEVPPPSGDEGQRPNAIADDANADTTAHTVIDGNGNKRPREDDEGDEAVDGTGKKHAPVTLVSNLGPNGTEGEKNIDQYYSGGDKGQDPAAGDDPTVEMVSESFQLPAALVGKLIGKGGETIRQLQLSTDTRIQVDHSGEGPLKQVTVSGYVAEQVAQAKAAILALDTELESSQIIECPPSVVGRIIGRGGETIRALQSASEAHITVNQDFPPDQPRQVIIQGKPEAIERASLMVNELIHGEPGSAQAIIQRVCLQHGIGTTEVMTAPKLVIGRIIGRGGETIKQIQKVSGSTVQIDQSGDPCRITLGGQPSAVDQAKAYITEIINGGDPFAQTAAFSSAAAYGGGGYGMGGYPSGAYGAGYGYPGAYGAGYGYPGAYGAAAGYPTSGDPYAAYAGGAGGGVGQVGQQQTGQYGAVGSGTTGGGGGGLGTAPSGRAGTSSAWQEYHDDQGRPYYYNTVTQQTQWDRPSDF